jgi:hypothetical protein
MCGNYNTVIITVFSNLHISKHFYNIRKQYIIVKKEDNFIIESNYLIYK